MYGIHSYTLPIVSPSLSDDKGSAIGFKLENSIQALLYTLHISRFPITREETSPSGHYRLSGDRSLPPAGLLSPVLRPPAAEAFENAKSLQDSA